MATYEEVQKGILEAQKTASLAQQQYASDVAAGTPQTYQPGTAISSSSLTSAPTPNFQSPTYPPVSSTDPALYAPTPKEAEASGLIKDIIGSSASLAGETAAFRASEEGRLGIEGLNTSEADLFAQLQQQNAEYKALEREDAMIPERQQRDATGRGITAGGLAPMTSAALRENFLRKGAKAADADVTAAMLAGVQGKILTAGKNIERAITNKFGAREAELKTKRDNLDLLLKDPSLTAEQQARAAKQASALKKEEQEIATAKENQKAIWDIAVEATRNIKNIANADPTLLARIQSAKTKEEALKIAGDAGLLATKIDQPASVQEYEYAKANGYKGTFSEYQNEDANRKIAIAKAGVNNLDPRQYTALNQITTRFQADPFINQALKGATAATIADQIIANPNSATNQLKSLYVLVKNLDPDSAVKEGEIALANQTQTYLQRFGNVLARVNEGRVISPEAAKELALATKDLMGAWNQTAQRRQQQYVAQAGTLGIGNEFNSYLSGANLGYNTSTPTIDNAPQLTTTQAQGSLDEDIKIIGSTFSTREELIAELVKDYSAYFPADQIAKRVYTLIPDK